MTTDQIPQHRRDDFFAGMPRLGMRTANTDSFHVRGPLTDRDIARYQSAGWYATDAKRARKARAERKVKRDGNFLDIDGSKIYCPV